MSDDAEALKVAQAPWTCTAQVYSIFMQSKPDKSTTGLPPTAYAPLERDSFFASPEAGRYIGGLGGLMVIRYTDTPVGPYDELLIIPGTFAYTMEEKGRAVEKKNPRISRIYVSQRHTMYNGRLNWNIPKHLAQFEWKDLPDGTKQVQVFPHEGDGYDGEATASPTPFFQASFKTVPFVPKFPFSTSWAKYVGLDFTLVQPPVPRGSTAEAVGTEQWCALETTQTSRQTHVGWFDMSQKDADGKSMSLFENFWPGLGRWQLGVRMDDATLLIPEGRYWEKASKVAARM